MVDPTQVCILCMLCMVFTLAPCKSSHHSREIRYSGK